MGEPVSCSWETDGEHTQALPPPFSFTFPQTNYEALSRSPSLPQPAAVRDCVLSSPQPPHPPIFTLHRPLGHLGGHIASVPPQYLTRMDLTCLSWLHQRGNLLPLQPLTQITTLPRH